ncbi:MULTISPECIES: multidrug ABC transporter ATPase [Microbacterium]|uniref:multidrug ABC transporter ATPase n=1 Tax=Microbacterium TaxID=33882 RepID=UPI000C2C575B|nr:MULTISPECIES: multidrug ABC transporter ATPase [Microbacterium]MDO8382612.1 multidrug ABC transporter ATPase [Microbacterium sp.]|tara:strand:+ start:1751 stop:2029 length:279 start_codon:yes stop_codon:yes gene_type:complete
MSTSPDSSQLQPGRAERILAFMSLGIALLSIVCFFAIIIGTATGMSQEDFSSGIWPLVALLPNIGLPLAFVLIITLLVITWARRKRANQASS